MHVVLSCRVCGGLSELWWELTHPALGQTHVPMPGPPHQPAVSHTGTLLPEDLSKAQADHISALRMIKDFHHLQA